MIDFYVDRFNTRANFTTNYYESNTTDTSEYVGFVYVDLENDRIYTVIDINTNIYHERTAYEPGSMFGDMNPNIAIVAMPFEFGTRLWVTLRGDPENIDVFLDLSIYNNHLYVASTSYTSAYSNNEAQTDIIHTKIRSDNGLVVHSKVLGLPSNDSA